jgi:hypothetical protein
VSVLIQEVAFVDGSVLEGEFLDELKILLDCILLQLDEVGVVGVEQTRSLIELGDHHGLCVLVVVLGEGAVAVVLQLGLFALIVLNMDFALFLSGIYASTSISHRNF